MAPAATPTGSRVPLRWALRIAATVAALGVIVWWLPGDELWRAMRSVGPVAWLIAIAAYLVLHLVGVVKWRGLINTAGAALPLRETAQAYYWGLFGNLFLPSIVGGDMIRAGVALRAARSRSAVLLGSLIDRMQDVIGLGVLAGVGALISPRALDENSRRVFLVFAVLVSVALVAGLATLRLFPVRLVPFRIRRLLVHIRRALRTTAARPGALVRAFLLGLALQTGLVMLNWQLGLLVGVAAPAYVWLFVWPLAKIAGLTPLTQGGIGVREAALAALFVPFGVTAVQAVAAGLAFATVLVAGGLVSGGIAVVLRRTGSRAGVPLNSPAGPAGTPV